MKIRAILVVARMSSSRFPGKALAPFRGQPMIAHVVDRARAAFPLDPLAVVTSDDPTDDPLAVYAAQCLDVRVHRGPLDDVFQRFRSCALSLGADWAIRINGDSPLISPVILKAIAARAVDPYDLVTTIAPRSLPKGQNAEAVRTALLAQTDAAAMSVEDREHITAYYHSHPDRFRIRNLSSGRSELADVNLSVDTPADLARLEAMADEEIRRLIPESLDG